MSSAGIKNWHWRTKGVEGWAKEWFAGQLVGLSHGGVTIDGVSDVEGDAEVGMRKSKLVTIYDQKITMTWSATDSAGEEVKGTLVALEVSHDMDEDDYEFESALTAGAGKEADAFRLAAKKKLADKLRPKFQQFPKDMLATHGKDLLAAEEDSSAPASGASTPVPASASASTASLSKAASTTSAGAKSAGSSSSIKTAVVKAEDNFQCTAVDLFSFLTDPPKIAIWSRNPAQMAPTVGAPMSLFGGNIAGEVTAVDPPRLLETTWRAPTWPEGHFGSLETRLEQGESSTKLSLRLSGVPVGKEEETEANLQRFYIAALKQIGFVSAFSSASPSAAPSPKASQEAAALFTAAAQDAQRMRRRREAAEQRKAHKSSAWWGVANGLTFLASAGLLAAFGAALYYGPTGQAWSGKTA